MSRVVQGRGPRPSWVALFGEAPGETEDKTGRPFAGKSGKELDRGLEIAGLDRGSLFISNICKTRPQNNKLPSPEEVAYWRPALQDELRTVRPAIILAAGALAARQFLPEALPMEALHGIPRLVRWADCPCLAGSPAPLPVGALRPADWPYPPESVLVIPIYHPAAPLHDTGLQTAFDRDWFNVGRAVSGQLRPWQPAEQPIVVRLADETVVDRLAAEAEIVALDTEGSREHPWGLSVAWREDEAWVIPVTAARLCQRLSDALAGKTVVLHWALHDLAVLRRLGVFPGRCRDTMRLARYIGETGGLKALGYRFAGRVLREYADVAAPLRDAYYRQRACDALDRLPAIPRKPKRKDFPKGKDGVWPFTEATLLWKEHEAQWAPRRRAWFTIINAAEPHKAWAAKVKAKTPGIPAVPVWIPPTDGPFLQYAGEDAATTIAILPTLARLATPQREYEALDNAILPLLDRMQAIGLPVDRRYLEDLGPLLATIREFLRLEMVELIGLSDDFNPDSGPQLKAILFGVLGLTPTKFSKKTGDPTADEKFLEPLRASVPFIDLLLQFRELGKLGSTYIAGWLRALDRDGGARICPHLDIGAKTGRLTADDPNTLAIPKHGAWAKLFRNAVRTAVPGRVIASWDMSQVELRVLAEMSGDPDMCQAFRDGRDIHDETASRIWKIPIARLDPDKHRLPAKTTNFGIPMGITGKGLSDQMGKFGIPGWDPDACDRLIDEWKHTAFPRAGAWLAENEAEAEAKGHVVGWGGKVFWLESIWSTDERVVAEAKRQASALKIQGGAQYLMKRAMIRIWNEVLPALQRRGYAECLMQIHDELVFELDEALVPEAHERVVEALTQTTRLSIPLLADGGYGPIWAGPGWQKLKDVPEEVPA